MSASSSAPLSLPYTAPSWLPSGHLQTIYPALFVPKPVVVYRRERWDTPDVDFVDGQPVRSLMVLLHALEGSSHSHDARAMMTTAASMGWCGAVPHFRGCSREINLAPRFYHSGDAEEIGWIIRRLASHAQTIAAGKLYAVGISVGGNALLRWLGKFQHDGEIVDAAGAISAPLDLAGGAALGKGFNHLCAQNLLRTMHSKSLAKLEQFPTLFDRERLVQARDLSTFDNIVTAPLHGFLDTDDCWHRASAKHVFGDIHVPTLVWNARNDPFLPERHLPLSDAPLVRLAYPEEGGHVGFLSARPIGPAGILDWLPRQAIHFLQGSGDIPPDLHEAAAGDVPHHG